MNYQDANGIEYVDATHNPLGGCRHDCRWQMPGGIWIMCYAKRIAESIAARSYPKGFEGYYWHPERLNEPLEYKVPLRVLLGSMTDNFGWWVQKGHIQAMLNSCEKASWHTFLTLTKNPKRYLDFKLPANVWAGFSTPPDYMWGKVLSTNQKRNKLAIDIEAMRSVRSTVKWTSAEPLSRAVADLFQNCGLDWAVIGAGSDGPRKYQPPKEQLEELLTVLDKQRIPIFMKGNLRYTPMRREFPKKTIEVST